MAAMLGTSTKRMLAHQELASERSAWRESNTSHPLVVTSDGAQAISSGKTPDLCACIFGGGGHEFPIGREASIPNPICVASKHHQTRASGGIPQNGSAVADGGYDLRGIGREGSMPHPLLVTKCLL
eukprot:CAMPEP_0181466404 /NCGR_PEP_ID=MMETSP1110-20121109/36446_1 /TAXON_ID=174948 /ORGANISM="Symbiodinium sp., Strain CCMP421" /LENGTH=125 /DNA_ID=CAMNT_0023591199 /DNA_START=72 /DNA_END=449 /DNA_ORIENTATION=+